MYVKCESCMHDFEVNAMKVQEWYQYYVDQSPIACRHCNEKLARPAREELQDYYEKMYRSRLLVSSSSIFIGIAIGMAILGILFILSQILEVKYVILALVLCFVSAVAIGVKGDLQRFKNNPFLLKSIKNAT